MTLKQVCGSWLKVGPLDVGVLAGVGGSDQVSSGCGALPLCFLLSLCVLPFLLYQKIRIAWGHWGSFVPPSPSHLYQLPHPVGFHHGLPGPAGWLTPAKSAMPMGHARLPARR